MIEASDASRGNARKKTNNRYIFYRYYCIAAIVLWNGVVVRIFIKGPLPLEFLVFGAFVFPALFMILNLAVFKFPYSIFGPLERSTEPNENVVYESRATWGKIGWFHGTMPFFSYVLYPSGLEIAILGIGKAFLRFDYVEELQSGFLRGYKIVHNSPEIRSPIYLPSKKWLNVFQQEYEKFKTKR